MESKVEEIIGSVNQNQRRNVSEKKKKWCDRSIYEICYLTSWSSRKELRENTLEEIFKDNLKGFPRTEIHELPGWKRQINAQHNEYESYSAKYIILPFQNIKNENQI